MSEKMVMRNVDTCIECGKEVYGNEMSFDSEDNCYCPECYQAVWGSWGSSGSSLKEED